MFQAKANKIVEAQQPEVWKPAILLQTSPGFVTFGGTLLLGSILDIEERAIALEARGFGRASRLPVYLSSKIRSGKYCAGP